MSIFDEVKFDRREDICFEAATSSLLADFCPIGEPLAALGKYQLQI
jgi:hypothetical protein